MSTSRRAAASAGWTSPIFDALNPHGRVPVIEDGDATVWESHAILRYLAAQYGHGSFWADDPATRARLEGWMDWSQTTLQPDFLNGVFWGILPHPPKRSATGRRFIGASPVAPMTSIYSTAF